jgi:hypothetical protein
MALISELNAATAEALTPLPLPTVAMFSRVLREAGLISKKGRGRGAAHATPLDGARLLIALLATTSPSQAADCVTDFGALVQKESYNAHVVAGSAFTLSAAYGLPSRHTFEEALAAVIAGFAEDRFAACTKALNYTRIEIRVWDTGTAAIQLNGNTYNYQFAAFVDCPSNDPDALDKAVTDFGPIASKYERGIKSLRSVETDVLRKIAAVINGPRV